MIRVNDTFLDKQPDYLIDSSPDDNSFWSKWFFKNHTFIHITKYL